MQLSMTGHSLQFGFFGIQIVAPSSIIDSLNFPALPLTSSLSAMVCNSFLVDDLLTSESIANSRDKTLITLPSTTARSLLNANDAIAAVV